jgi:low affinity Fe/Cu permease
MKKTYRFIERSFEKLASVAIFILGNPISFIVALCVVIYWLSNKQFYTQDIHQSIGDVILGIAFLSLFIIQKSFNRFSASLQLKVNELVASHESAKNALINVEGKTEREVMELAKEYTDIAKQITEDNEEK